MITDRRSVAAQRVAKQAGALAQTMRRDRPKDFVAIKGKNDFVTLADREVERVIRAALLTEFPQDGFFGEEGGAGTVGEYTWVVDPIDGTTNYLRGLPEWGVSIACVKGQDVIYGVVDMPDLDKTAVATLGQGAFINDQRLSLADQPDAAIGIAVLGHSERSDLDAHLRIIARLLDRNVDYRRQGAACIGLVSVAAGWADIYYEPFLNAWDALAGVLLITEAGGTCDTPKMADFLSNGGAVLAARNQSTRTKMMRDIE